MASSAIMDIGRANRPIKIPPPTHAPAPAGCPLINGDSLIQPRLGVSDLHQYRFSQEQRQSMPVTSVLTILRAIKQHAPISRTELQRRTGLSWGTVTNTTRQLLHLKLICEQNGPSTKSGRKPMHLTVDPTGPCLVGIEISPSAIRGLVTTLAGETLFEEVRPLSGASAKALVHTAELVQCAQKAAHPRELLGVGISLPNNHLAVPNPATAQPWQDATLRAILQSQFRLPVSLQHHAAALALAERWFGNVPEGDFLCLDLAQSVSLAAVIEDELCPASNTPPNFAHFSLDPAGPSCACGSRGCVDAYCSIPALLSFAQHAGGAERSGSIEELAARAAAGDVPARAAFDRLGEYLALALGNLIQLFHPARIVLTGPTLAAADYFLPGLTAHLALPNPLGGARHSVDLQTPILSQLGPRAPALGAAATLLQSTLTPPPPAS
jgi:predicted NBD/HSP70 family sugar kinase